MSKATSGVSERVGVGTKLAFGVGSAGESCAHVGFTQFNMIYYANVLGLSGTLAGAATLIALVFDAVTDPLMGSISDRFRSRLGRRHPFMYLSAVPMGLSFAAIYHPPRGLEHIGLFLWLTTFTVLLRIAMTLFSVPHLALGAELSRDYQQRSAVMAYHALFQVVGGAGVAFLGWRFLAQASGGSTVASNFAPIGIGAGAFMATVVLLSAQGTRSRIPQLAKAPEGLVRLTFRIFWSEVMVCMRNRNYLMLLIGLLLFSATYGLREALFGHVTLFFWELPEQQIKLFHLATPPAYFSAFIMVPLLHRFVEKRSTIVMALVICLISSVLPVTGRLLGIMPGNGSPGLLSVLLSFFGFFYFGIAMLTISVMSALADVSDEHELAHGRAQEGIFYAARTFFQKATSGLGAFLAGFALDLIAFPTGATPGQVGDDQVLRLGLVDGLFGCLPMVIAIFFYSRYSITRAEHARVAEQLAQRRRVEHEGRMPPVELIEQTSDPM